MIPTNKAMETTAPPRSDANATRFAEADAWVFDLDNTLYPASSNLFDQIDHNITTFIAENLQLKWKDAYRVQKTYFHEHGTTMRGLMDRHGIDPAEFLEYVHDIKLSPVNPAPTLERALNRLSGRKIIFTNGSTDHAQRVMARLGVGHHFEAVFDIVESDYVPKPEPTVYARLVERYRINPTTTVMVDDIARNLAPAAALGMTTVWVRTGSQWGSDQSDGKHIHHVVDDLAHWLDDLTSK